MTPEQQIAAIKKAEYEFLEKVDMLKKEYQAEIKEILKKIDSKKIEALKAELRNTK